MTSRKSEAATETVLPLVEEDLHLEKREISKGKIRVRTVVETVEDVAHATLNEDVLRVTRVPFGTVVSEAPSVRTEGELTIIPVLEEIVVVEKRLVLVEEIHIRRSTRTEEVSVPVSLRKQRAVIEAVNPDASKAQT